MKKDYLPHIDLLRAIAVLLVIFHHLNITLFSGGFIGVDIFFVISGYLITKNIQQEIQKNTFSFLNFYQRRVLRLAPAFFTVLICSTLAFWFFSTPSELYAYFKSLIAATGLSINIYFWQSLSDYFSIDAHTTPLLHIWSLSLEEQFYLLWPTLLLLLIKLDFRIKLILFFTLFISSFSYSYYAALHNPIFAYYLLPTRFFEFMLGALLVFLPQRNFSAEFRILLAIFSLCILFIFSFILTKDSIFPSYNALFVCCSSAIYIYFSRINKKKKIWQPMLYLGKISYPMYLWHWIIIVGVNIHSIVLNTTVRIFVIITIIFLSWLTYERIEKPSKTIKNHQNTIGKLFILPSLILTFISILYIKNFNYKQQRIQIVTSGNNIPLTKDAIRCIDRHDHPRIDCFFGDLSQQDTKILLLGDSHANAQRGFIDVLAKDTQLKGYEITYSSTAFLPHLERFSYSHRSKEIELIPSFRIINDTNILQIKTKKFQYVILGGYFPHNTERHIYSLSTQYFNPEKSHQLFIQGFNNTIELIIKNNAIPIIINDNPILQNVDINCNLRTNTPKDKCFFKRQKHDQNFKDWTKDLEYLKSKYPQLIVLDFTSIICSKTLCYSYLNDVPLYRDEQHLTYLGSTEIGLQYLKQYGNPLKPHEK